MTYVQDIQGFPASLPTSDTLDLSNLVDYVPAYRGFLHARIVLLMVGNVDHNIAQGRPTQASALLAGRMSRAIAQATRG